jgi:hypothetical protein
MVECTGWRAVTLVIAIISERSSRVVLAIEIAAVVEVIYCADVLREEKVHCPIKRHTNLFVQAGQLAQGIEQRLLD